MTMTANVRVHQYFSYHVKCHFLYRYCHIKAKLMTWCTTVKRWCAKTSWRSHCQCHCAVTWVQNHCCTAVHGRVLRCNYGKVILRGDAKIFLNKKPIPGIQQLPVFGKGFVLKATDHFLKHATYLKGRKTGPTSKPHNFTLCSQEEVEHLFMGKLHQCMQLS